MAFVLAGGGAEFLGRGGGEEGEGTDEDTLEHVEMIIRRSRKITQYETIKWGPQMRKSYISISSSDISLSLPSLRLISGLLLIIFWLRNSFLSPSRSTISLSILLLVSKSIW